VSQQDDQRLLATIAETAPAGSRLLNLPAGEGLLSRQLREHGHDVVSADLFPEGCTQSGDKCVEADMNERLPFDDDSFDGVLCQEGVEHLENLAGFFRECRRILKAGGHFWITTPNFMDISSRLSFLLSGQKSYRAGLPNERSTIWGRDGERVYHGHAFSLPYFQLRYLLRVNHFDDIELSARGWSTSSRMLYPFFRPIIGLALGHGLKTRQARDRRKGAATIDDALRETLYKDGVSKALLCGKGILVHARHRDGSGLVPSDETSA